ncbi:low affinity immunoglobulin gamma Fc region receptor II-like [Mugil cephalus]|uniref:low affinity immunoglobulin gamma Fc region receptor II-like n=1 Tax=Mugil cephalus TaxID=48193 RepID=UPI001FB7935B|nr:low affinity immunoglobulin gamma Fc region receptor II-like [Mugil cephalus]
MILLCAHNQEVDAAFLRISPNRLQFFEYESVTLYCDGVFYCDVEHKLIGVKPSCCTTNDRTFKGPTCTIKNIYEEDSGKYWCEEGGQRSNIININVVSGSVILESPALPVVEGEDVTLSCRTNKSSSNITIDFYKDGILEWRSSTGNMNIKTVSMSDHGYYKCHISGVGESPQSWLTVREMNPTSSCRCNENLTEHLYGCHVYPFLRTVFTIIMVALLLLLLGYLHCVLDRHIKHDSSQTEKGDFCYIKEKDGLDDNQQKLVQ